MLHVFNNRITRFIKSNVITPLLFNRITRIINYWMRLLFKKESKFVTLDHYIATNPNDAVIITSNREETFCCAEQTSFNYAHIAQKGRTVDCFVALLKNASCFAFSDLIILSDGSYYCEIKTDPILGKSSDCNDGFILRRDGKYSHYTDIPKKAVRLSSGILLSGLFSWNYYHYTFQIIPKVQWISMIPPSVPLLVDDKVEDIPSFAELLKICNKQNRPIYCLFSQIRINSSGRFASPVLFLSSMSLGVYMIHPLVLKVSGSLGLDMWTLALCPLQVVGVLLLLVLTVIVSVVLSYVIDNGTVLGSV